MVEKDTCIPLFIAALFTIARTWKQPRYPSTDEWIKKLWYCQLKNDVQLGSCELSFIWGKMRTAAREAASQIALRDCSKVLVKGECNAVKHSFYKRI